MSDTNKDLDPASASGSPGPQARANLLDRYQAAAAARLAQADRDSQLLPDRLCQAVAEVTGVQGAAISVYLGADIAIPIGASSLEATRGEALQFTVREGPCFSSYTSHRPVLVPDLDEPGSQAWSNWPTYAEMLTRYTPFHAVFAYPLLNRGLPMGSLGLYRQAAGTLEAPSEVEAIAAHVAEQLLQAEVLLDAEGQPEHQWMNGPTALRRRTVWLAQGLTLQANHITPGQALELMRAQAFSADCLLDELAEGIVAGRLPVPELESQQ
jgi:GAF domain-containing protein